MGAWKTAAVDTIRDGAHLDLNSSDRVHGRHPLPSSRKEKVPVIHQALVHTSRREENAVKIWSIRRAFSRAHVPFFRDSFSSRLQLSAPSQRLSRGTFGLSVLDRGSVADIDDPEAPDLPGFLWALHWRTGNPNQE